MPTLPNKPAAPRAPGAPAPAAQAPTLKLRGPVTPQALQQTLVEMFQSPNYRPPVLPRVAMQLTALTRQSSVSYDEVVNVLQKDPMIAASVLKVAQSPMYGGRRPVQSLKEALQRLGVTRLRDIVWQVVTGMRMLRGGALTSVMEQLQGHNLFVAHAARLVAERANIVTDEAFLCGLLHDVGISAVLSALIDSGEPLPPLGTLVEAMDSFHEQAGGLIASLWQLSPDLSLVIKMHHRYNPHAKGVPLLAGVICVAEQLAHEVGRVVIKNPGSEAERTFDQQAVATFEQALKRLELNGKYPQLLNEAKQLNTQLASS